MGKGVFEVNARDTSDQELYYTLNVLQYLNGQRKPKSACADDSEGPDQPAHPRRLIWAFAVRIYLMTRFRMARSMYYSTLTHLQPVFSI